MAHNQFIESTLRLCPVIPVLSIENPADAVPLAQALVAGGLKVLEVTLRTPRALEVIEAMARGVPEAIVIAGTVIRPAQMRSARDAGARMAVSPGLIPSLLEASHKPGSLALLGGASTASELMLGIEAGLENFKLFPAQAVGGLGLLKAWYGPFASLNFCPTGGIDLNNAKDYLALPNVACVGGSWMVPQKALLDADWAGITAMAQVASQLRS